MEELINSCLAFIKIGAFSFGGGYAVLALIQKEVVENYGWISSQDFVNIVAIAEMTPGPIAVNSSTFVGYTLGGVLLAILLSICAVLIPFLLSLIVSIYFSKFENNITLNLALGGIRPVVIGVIASACIAVAKISIVNIHNIIFFLIALFLVAKVKINPIGVLTISGALGVLYYQFLIPMLI